MGCSKVYVREEEEGREGGVEGGGKKRGGRCFSSRLTYHHFWSPLGNLHAKGR